MEDKRGRQRRFPDGYDGSLMIEKPRGRKSKKTKENHHEENSEEIPEEFV